MLPNQLRQHNPDHNAVLVEHFLNVPVAQGKSVVKPESVLDDGHREAVAVGFQISHDGLA